MLAESSLVLITEGPNDKLLLKRHISSEHIVLREGRGGKKNLEKLAQELASNNIKSVRILLDRDYEISTPSEGNDGIAILTDTHDLFMDLFLRCRGPIIEKIDCAIERTNRKNSTGSSSPSRLTSAKTIVDKAVQYASRIGVLRSCCLEHDLHLPFKKLPYHEYLQLFKENSKECPNKKVLDILSQRSDTSIDKPVHIATLSRVSVISRSNESTLQKFVGDHDLIGFISCLSRELDTSVGEDSIRDALAIGFPCDQLTEFHWHQKLTLWGTTFNRPIFKCSNSSRCTSQ